MSITIQAMTEKDGDEVWSIMEPIIRAGETYAFPRDWSKDNALSYWCQEGHEVFIAINTDCKKGEIVGTYFLHANQKGGGSHVSNCGYMTKSGSYGKGIARQMCSHSLEQAKQKGFRAMQYNFVVKSNERAVKLWQSMGFNIVGELPEAFLHPSLGYTSAYVMYRFL
jgi:ribosomal protein S18 acetylase RimI-like enzyme